MARDAPLLLASRASYALLQAARGKEAERTNNQDERDGDENKRLAEWSERFRQKGLEQDRADANDKAADRRAGQTAKTADDGADKGDHDELQAHSRLDEAGLRNDHACDRSRRETTYRESRGDDAVRPNSQRLGHPKVLGSRAHLETEACRSQEPGCPGEKRQTYGDRHEMQELQA